jgi:hypothetical protein
MLLTRRAQVLIAFGLIFHSHDIHAQAGAVAQPANKGVSQEKLLEDIVSTNARVRFDAAMQIEGQQDQMLANLAALLKSPISDDRKMDAAAILGENKSSYAISYLVNHLEWQTNLISNPAAHSNFYGDLFSSWIPLTNPSGHQSDLSALIRTVPVTRSLARIGVDAIPALLDRISQSDDEGIIETCDNTCIVIEGGGNIAAEVTQLRLQDRLQKETDPKKKERFQTALDILKKIWPPY